MLMFVSNSFSLLRHLCISMTCADSACPGTGAGSAQLGSAALPMRRWQRVIWNLDFSSLPLE